MIIVKYLCLESDFIEKGQAMDLYILGIGGTFMGHLALLAKQLGLSVSGCDQNVYSPMKEMLIDQGITYDEGYQERFLNDHHQCYVIGNAMSRGNPMVEAILNQRRPMISGPQWLYEHVLQSKWVIAVSGTHGKTTTTSMIAWILKSLGYNPGYLIGGAAKGFDRAADIGTSDYFVIEADEYDTAFFDKRSKFVHYRPKTLVMNNLEFDHADIFQSIEDIKKTFHHLVRTIPSEGRVIYPYHDVALSDVLSKGCWSEQCSIQLNLDCSQILDDIGQNVSVTLQSSDASQMEFRMHGERVQLQWELIGHHNAANAAAAIAAVEHLGVSLSDAVAALADFPGVVRRMELRLETPLVRLYDDFAHHPTAIASSLAGLRAQVGERSTILAIIELRSNTMAMGIHQNTLLQSVCCADEVYWLRRPGMKFDIDELVRTVYASGHISESQQHFVCDSAEALEVLLMQRQLERQSSEVEHWLCMSNGTFCGLFQRLEKRLVDRLLV